MPTVKKTFETELIEGHKGVVVVLVPFDPEAAFRCSPVRLAGRRHGWPVAASIDGIPFDGYVGERWGRFFVIVEPEVRARAGVGVGSRVAVVLSPSEDARIVAGAVGQSRSTTQPTTARADARVLADAPARRATRAKRTTRA